MTNPEQKDDEDVLERLLRRLAEEPSIEQEEADNAKAEWTVMKPATYESAYMNEAEEISVEIFQYLEDGTTSCGSYTLKPGDIDYKELVEQHGQLKPGQGSTIVQKWVNGKWIDADTVQFHFDSICPVG